MIRFELYFGLAIKRAGCLPRTSLHKWLCKHCTLSAYSLINTRGYWGRMEETSVCLVTLVPTSDARATKEALKRLATHYRRSFNQQAVLLCWFPINSELLEAK